MIKPKILKIGTLLLCISIFFINLTACNSQNDISYGEKVNAKQADFSVHYIDVGQGDCFFINFPDGKNLLIDSGKNSKTNFSKIKAYLDEYDCERIDYLVLTHPDENHIGNALSIIENYSVGLVYLPYIVYPEDFPSYFKIINLINQKQIETELSMTGKSFSGEDYFFCFLTPLEKDNLDSSYNDFNFSQEYTSRQLDDISPIMFLRYKDVRFVFCSDAGQSQEKIVVEYQKLGIYDIMFNSKVNLASVNYLCLSSHGGNGCSSQEFLSLINPKNVVVSVGGENYEGCPSTAVLERLDTVNKDYNFYRTDVYGTVSIFVGQDGKDFTYSQFEK